MNYRLEHCIELQVIVARVMQTEACDEVFAFRDARLSRTSLMLRIGIRADLSGGTNLRN